MMNPKYAGACTEACYSMPECDVCGQRKAPRGRDVPSARGGDYCSTECPGYTKMPIAGHLWPGEPPPDWDGEIEEWSNTQE